MKTSKMSKSKKLSVIIVSYNSKKNLKKCVDSLYNIFPNSFSWEVIVVNNDERENLLDLPIDFSKVEIIDHKKNIGFGAGINLGIKKAQGEFLFILNPDTEVFSDNIQDVLDEFYKDKKIGIIGGGILDKNGQKQKWSAGKEISLCNLIMNNLGFSRSENIWKSSSKQECDWVAGTALFIKKDLFEKIGGFDDNFFMYFEDMDLCHWVRKSGKKVVFYPEFQVYHGSGESYENKKLQKKHYYDSMEKFLNKYSRKMSLFIVKFIRKFGKFES